MELLLKKIKRLSPLNILFLNPLKPHFNIIEDFIHTDDMPVLLFILLVSIRFKSLFINFKPIKGYLFIDIFILYLLIQNIYLGNGYLNNEIIRFIFYALIFFFVLGNKMKTFYEYLPVYLFIFCSSFSIMSYFFSINLGTDLYNNWNIGLNLSDIDYIKGRVNGFQAGGPNSYADLITVTGIYTIFKLEDNYFPYISSVAILGCFFTYSRFSLVVLIIFIILRVFTTQRKMLSFGTIFVAILICVNFGLIERFTNDDNSGIQDRVDMNVGALDYLLEDTLINNLIGRGHNSFIINGNEIIESESFEQNTVSYGPHNSFLFIILNYGIIGLILYLLIFKNIIVYTFKLKTLFNLSAHFYVVAAFFVLSFSSDLLQNHSVSWYLYLSSFLLMREIHN